MKNLPVQHFYCENQIACRFLRPPSEKEPLVFAIPGGPGLSGHYLDHFLSAVAEREKVNVGIMDLPNHGQSVLSTSKSPLSYRDCIDLTDGMLREIAQVTENLILFGQSFGARLAFDLLAFSHSNIIGAFLTGFPYKFEMSQGMINKISKLNITSNDLINSEEKLKQQWIEILSFYTVSPLPPEVFEIIASDTNMQGNENILDEVPSIDLTVKSLSEKSTLPLIGILQGDLDKVVPDDNFLNLKNMVPYAKFFEIQNCGHFPTAEKPLETLRSFSQFYTLLEKNHR